VRDLSREIRPDVKRRFFSSISLPAPRFLPVSPPSLSASCRVVGVGTESSGWMVRLLSR